MPAKKRPSEAAQPPSKKKVDTAAQRRTTSRVKPAEGASPIPDTSLEPESQQVAGTPDDRTSSSPSKRVGRKKPAVAASPAVRKETAPRHRVARPKQPARSAPVAHAVPIAQESERALRVLMVTPEAHPFAKTGGLAEVAAALPAALNRLGHRTTVILPRYRGVSVDAADALPFEFTLGTTAVRGRFLQTRTPDGVRSALVDVPALYDRPGLYGSDGRDYSDNAFRFAVLSRAALEYARAMGERPDIIHAHDWQTGLVPVYQKMLFSADPIVGRVPVVFTIHNLAFQGIFSADTLMTIGLGWEVFDREALEYWGNVSLLKGGVNFSEKITTVSPTYAKQIVTPELGFGFEGVLARRAADLVGIVNGIDTMRWNPEADPFLAAPYSPADLNGKTQAKRVLLTEVNLPADENGLRRPLIGVISRLTDQKGFDLIGAVAAELMALDAAWVMLGSGERHYEDLLRAMARRHPDRVSATIGFDERLAHLIEAGADLFLMPSRFEPCGLNQLYSLRYGTVPIVRATGGLDDTVIDADLPGGNGVKFEDYTRDGLLWALQRALDLYRDSERWQALQRAGMAVDHSWDVSAREYVKVYRDLQKR